MSHAVNAFAGNFTMALNPQITKNYSTGNYCYMVQLIYRGAKYSAFLLWIIGLPILIQVDFILDLWLVEVPLYAPMFVRLAILYSICNALSLTLYYGILATGNIKGYHIIVTTINLMAFPICYVAFYMGLGAEWGYWAAIIAMLLSLFGRIFMLHRQLRQFTILGYLKNTLIKVILVVVLSFLCVSFINSISNGTTFLNLAMMTSLSLLINMVIIFIVGFDSMERAILYKSLEKYYSLIVK